MPSCPTCPAGSRPPSRSSTTTGAAAASPKTPSVSSKKTSRSPTPRSRTSSATGCGGTPAPSPTTPAGGSGCSLCPPSSTAAEPNAGGWRSSSSPPPSSATPAHYGCACPATTPGPTPSSKPSPASAGYPPSPEPARRHEHHAERQPRKPPRPDHTRVTTEPTATTPAAPRDHPGPTPLSAASLHYPGKSVRGHPTERGDNRRRDPSMLAQLAHVKLTADLDTGDEEEERHQAVIDPVTKVERELASADPDRERGAPEVFVARRPWRVRPHQRRDCRCQQDNSARVLCRDELSKRPGKPRRAQSLPGQPLGIACHGHLVRYPIVGPASRRPLLQHVNRPSPRLTKQRDGMSVRGWHGRSLASCELRERRWAACRTRGSGQPRRTPHDRLRRVISGRHPRLAARWGMLPLSVALAYIRHRGKRPATRLPWPAAPAGGGRTYCALVRAPAASRGLRVGFLAAAPSAGQTFFDGGAAPTPELGPSADAAACHPLQEP